MFSLDSGWQTWPYDETVTCVWLTRSSIGSLVGSAGVSRRAPPRHKNIKVRYLVNHIK